MYSTLQLNQAFNAYDCVISWIAGFAKLMERPKGKKNYKSMFVQAISSCFRKLTWAIYPKLPLKTCNLLALISPKSNNALTYAHSHGTLLTFRKDFV